MLEDLYQDVIDRRRERIKAANARWHGLLETHKAYMTLGLRLHFDNVIERSLKTRDDGSLLTKCLDEIEAFLANHKKRCDAIGDRRVQ